MEENIEEERDVEGRERERETETVVLSLITDAQHMLSLLCEITVLGSLEAHHSALVAKK